MLHRNPLQAMKITGANQVSAISNYSLLVRILWHHTREREEECSGGHLLRRDICCQKYFLKQGHLEFPPCPDSYLKQQPMVFQCLIVEGLYCILPSLHPFKNMLNALQSGGFWWYLQVYLAQTILPYLTRKPSLACFFNSDL